MAGWTFDLTPCNCSYVGHGKQSTLKFTCISKLLAQTLTGLSTHHLTVPGATTKSHSVTMNDLPLDRTQKVLLPRVIDLHLFLSP